MKTLYSRDTLNKIEDFKQWRTSQRATVDTSQPQPDLHSQLLAWDSIKSDPVHLSWSNALDSILKKTDKRDKGKIKEKPINLSNVRTIGRFEHQKHIYSSQKIR